MAITIGEKEIVRFTVDTKARRIVIEFEQAVTEDGVIRQVIPSALHVRRDEYFATLGRLFPTSLTPIETEAKKIDSEKWEAEKLIKRGIE